MTGRVIRAALLRELRAIVAAAPDTEVCGLLFGTDREIVAAEATPNVAADPYRRFEIDPARLIAAYRAQREGGPRLIGHYHSHPSGAASPSASDRAAAEAHLLWLILTLRESRLWEYRQGDFVGLELILG